MKKPNWFRRPGVLEEHCISQRRRFSAGIQGLRCPWLQRQHWNTTVSVWLRLNPDLDLEPGYCDPVQIVGDDSKKGFIFLEFSKDETPRYFRYAIRPLFHIWNPDNVAVGGYPF